MITDDAPHVFRFRSEIGHNIEKLLSSTDAPRPGKVAACAFGGSGEVGLSSNTANL